MAALPPEYRAEPALALAGGDDGMDFVRTLMRDVAPHLTDDGRAGARDRHERPHFEARFALQPAWLPTSAGDDQVLLLERRGLA